MPQYLAPGVYVEEVSSGIKPIAGVGTSTAGFIGVVSDATLTPLRPGRDPYRPASTESTDETTEPPDETTEPPEPPEPAPTRELKTRETDPDDFYPLALAGQRVLITSWESFKNNFGDIEDGNRLLAHAVYGFFNNGGTRCWIVRYTDATTSTNVAERLATLSPVDEIALVAIPGATDAAIQNAILDHCENAQDRFAILDGVQTTTLTKVAIQGDTRDSSYGAIYYPWIDVGDPKQPYIPPTGHIAGVYARVDAERGVHKAPANEVIRGALDVENLLSRADQDGLNPDDINVIRKFDGNVTIWGAHTLAGKEDAEWRYINVRRLFNYLRESIDEGIGWAVFEPNAPDLWSKIRRNVGAFLTLTWASGALFGATPEQAFYVRCDESTNPSEVRDQGQVVTEIGVAVVKPAEFVIFRISQWAGVVA